MFHLFSPVKNTVKGNCRAVEKAIVCTLQRLTATAFKENSPLQKKQLPSIIKRNKGSSFLVLYFILSPQLLFVLFFMYRQDRHFAGGLCYGLSGRRLGLGRNRRSRLRFPPAILPIQLYRQKEVP